MTEGISVYDEDGNELQVVRANMPFGSLGDGESGTYYIAYAADPAQDREDPLFLEAERWATQGLASAPVILVVCGDTTVMPLEEMGSSIFPAAQNILLAASALGLGSLMASLPIYAPDGAFARVLELPGHVVPLATLPVGYPVHPLGRPRRKAIQTKTSRDRFGQPW